MKKISIVIPCFNEEGNVKRISEAVINIMTNSFSNYDYEVIFIDNNTKDNTRNNIKELCANNKKIKAIFNIKNFGQFNSPYYGLLQSTGDAAILMACDFEEPVELIPKFIKAWEDGYKIAVGVKNKSNKSFIIKKLKQFYYYLSKKYSSVDQIKMFTGFGLYDKDFLNILRKIDDPTPFFRGLVAEYGYKIKEFYFEQGYRTKGRSSNNFYSLYDGAMLSFTSYTKIGLRMATFIGFIALVFSFLVSIVYLIMKLIWWDRFPAGMIPILLGMMFLGSVQIFFIGIIGEYILSINTRVMKHPLVVEEERINF